MRKFLTLCLRKDHNATGYEDLRSTAASSVVGIQDANKVVSSRMTESGQKKVEADPCNRNGKLREEVLPDVVENQGQQNASDHIRTDDDQVVGKEGCFPAVDHRGQHEDLPNKFQPLNAATSRPIESKFIGTVKNADMHSPGRMTMSSGPYKPRSLKRNRIIADQCKLTPPRSVVSLPEMLSYYATKPNIASPETSRMHGEKQVEISDVTSLAWRQHSDHHLSMPTNVQIDPEESDMVESTSGEEDEEDDYKHYNYTRRKPSLQIQSKHMEDTIVETVDSAPIEDDDDNCPNETEGTVSAAVSNAVWRHWNVEKLQYQDDINISYAFFVGDVTENDDEESFGTGFSRPGTDDGENKPEDMIVKTKSGDCTLSTQTSSEGDEYFLRHIANSKKNNYAKREKSSNDGSDRNGLAPNGRNLPSKMAATPKLRITMARKSAVAELDAIAASFETPTTGSIAESQVPERKQSTQLLELRASDSLSYPYVISSFPDSTKGAISLKKSQISTKSSITLPPSRHDTFPVMTSSRTHHFTKAKKSSRKISENVETDSLNGSHDTSITATTMTTSNSASPASTNSHNHYHDDEWRLAPTPETKGFGLNLDQSDLSTPYALHSRDRQSSITPQSHSFEDATPRRELHCPAAITNIMNETLASQSTNRPQETIGFLQHRHNELHVSFSPQSKTTVPSRPLIQFKKPTYVDVLASKSNTTEDEPNNEADYDDDGALSDIPSDVELEIKERYLRACRKLKSSIVDRKQGNIVKAFEKQLLQDFACNTDAKPLANRLVAKQERIDNLHSNNMTPRDNDASVSSYMASNAMWKRTSDSDRRLTSDDTRETSNVSQKRFPFPKTSMSTPEVRSNLTSRSQSPSVSRVSDCTPQINNVQSANSEKREMPTFDPVPTNRHVLMNGTLSFQTKEQPTVSLSLTDDDFEDDISRPFLVMGVDDLDQPTVLTPTVMEALRGFLPYRIMEENFLLKYAVQRDGNTLNSLLSKIQGCKHTVIVVETTDGDIFGSFCSSYWHVQPSWFGSGESFLWRLKNRRTDPLDPRTDDGNDSTRQNLMEIYPYTGHDEMVQYCTTKTIAVGGGGCTSKNMNEQLSRHTNDRGIGLMIDGDLMGGETNHCATFANPRLNLKNKPSLSFSSSSSSSDNDNEFEIHALEIWTLTPCLSMEAAMEMEGHLMQAEKHIIFTLK